MQRKTHLILTSLVMLGLFGGLSLTPFLARATETTGNKTEQKVDPNADQWFVRCDEKPKAGADDKAPKVKQCEVFQRLVVTKTNQRLVEFAMAYVGEKKEPHGTIIIPLGTLLQKGVEIRVDGNPPLKNEIRYCTADGCFVHFALDETILKTMSTGNKVVVTFVLAMPKKISVELSLKGFGKALDKLAQQ